MVDKKLLTAKKYYNKQFTRKLSVPKSILRITWCLSLQRRMISCLPCLVIGWRENWRTRNRLMNGECSSGNSFLSPSDTIFWSSETVLVYWEYKSQWLWLRGGACKRCVFTLMRGTRAGPCTNNNKELTEKLKITSIVNSPLISNEEQVPCYSLFIRKLYIASAVWNMMWSSANRV